MLEANLNAVSNDVNVLIKDAQELFHAATAQSGQKADDMRQRGMLLLDSALARAQDLQNTVTAAGKEAVLSADGYVRANPWRAVAAAGGLGVLAALIWSHK